MGETGSGTDPNLVREGDVFTELTALSSGTGMAMLMVICAGCGKQSRIRACTLVSGKNKRCHKCESARTVEWVAPEKWKNPAVDERNAAVIAAQEAGRKRRELEKKPGNGGGSCALKSV